MENSRLRHPAFHAPRRAVTAPITSFSLLEQDGSSSSSSSAAAGQLGGASVETLYNHPSVKIVSFTAGNRPRSLSPRRSLAAAAEEQPGTLPSSSRLERTIAVGTFQIYRAPGSVAFLRCGSALQPILPKSQCWCIDEASSKFVLQIRRPNYWRIEVPVAEDEDVRRALLLREIFDRILQFEKTPCPFQRSFTVDLPEQPQTPVKKRPWTPVRKPPALAQCPPTPVELTPKAKAPTRLEGSEHERPQTAWSDTVSEDSIATPRARGARDPELEPVPEPEDEVPADGPETAAGTEESPEGQPGESLYTQPISEELLPKVKEIVATYDEVSEQAAIQNEQNRRASSTEATEQALQPAEGKPLPAEIEVLPKQPEMQVQEQEEEWEQEVAVVSNCQETDDVFESSQPDSFEGSGLMRTKKGRITSFASRRAATAPPQLTLYTSPPSKSASASKVPSIEETPEPAPTESNSPTDSSASFHSVQSWESLAAPLPPSPPLSNPNSPTKFPYPHQNISRPKQRAAQREPGSSRLAVAPQPAWDAASAGAADGTQGSSTIAPSSSVSVDGADLAPSETQSSEEYHTPPQDGDAPAEAASSFSTAESSTALSRRPPYRTRATTSSISTHTALSPLPPAANLFSPRRQQQQQQRNATAPAPAPALARGPETAMRSRASASLAAARRLPSAIINKTCEILLSPPSHLISLMLTVAARIAAGQWRGYLFGTDEGGERVDVRWDWSDTDDGALEGWEDGDFDFDSTPVPLRRRRGRAATVTAEDEDRAESRPSPVLRQRASLPVLNKQKTPLRRLPGSWQSPMEEAEDSSGSWGVD